MGWLARTPCGSVIATVLCLLGVGCFCFTIYLGASISILVIEPVFHVNPTWIDTLRIICIGIFVGMACLGAMIIFIGLLSTGSTRYRVFAAKRVLCAVVMVITYVVYLGWSLTLCFMVVITFSYTIFCSMCSSLETVSRTVFSELEFLFPNSTFDEHLKECEVKKFCEERVERAEIMCIVATVSTLLVLLSLVHYLICLSANYPHMRDDEKIQELLRIQRLAQMEYTAPSKSRIIELQDKSTDI